VIRRNHYGKELIIVCKEKFRMYGDFLAQLISMEDDRDEELVGVKDGSVAAQVWIEKDFDANAAQISSEQYILFIGNSRKQQVSERKAVTHVGKVFTMWNEIWLAW